MFANVAVSHPAARVRHIDENFHGVAGLNERGVFPDKIVVLYAVR